MEPVLRDERPEGREALCPVGSEVPVSRLQANAPAFSWRANPRLLSLVCQIKSVPMCGSPLGMKE